MLLDGSTGVREKVVCAYCVLDSQRRSWRWGASPVRQIEIDSQVLCSIQTTRSTVPQTTTTRDCSRAVVLSAPTFGLVAYQQPVMVTALIVGAAFATALV